MFLGQVNILYCLTEKFIIINFRKKILFKFKNFSDTQVLVNLFDKDNIKNIINELDGMYAFILYDKVKKKNFF